MRAANDTGAANRVAVRSHGGNPKEHGDEVFHVAPGLHRLGAINGPNEHSVNTSGLSNCGNIA